nr:hypothetical protein [Tanacetum cinerariifolium]
MIEADEQMASRLQSKEQEQFTIKEKARMLVEMIAERKRFFATQRAAEQRCKLPTQAQMRNRMLVMKRLKSVAPKGYDLILWGDLKIMIEPNKEDKVWKNQQEWSVISWKLYEYCGVHTLLMDGILVCINMLVEMKYPLTKEMLTRILNSRLKANLESTMAFELIRFIKAQLEE